MYYLTTEENKYLLKGLIPRAREIGVDDELRGWNWHKPPLLPIYDVPLGLYEVAGKYCPTGRDVYLRKGLKKKTVPNYEMELGSALHETLSFLFQKTKKLIYLNGVSGYQEIFEELETPEPTLYQLDKPHWNDEKFKNLEHKVKLVWDFTRIQIMQKIQETLTKQPYIGEDSLIALAVPFIMEQKLDGSFLGLSRYLSVDGFTMAEPMILDAKFGPLEDFHPLYTTGYGMVMESIYEYPINLGCVVYVRFDGNRIFVRKHMHILSDELRQWFIEERDHKMRLVYDEIDPGIEKDMCPANCPYFNYCFG